MLSKKYIPFVAAMELLGTSSHTVRLKKKKRMYPKHFKNINKTECISMQLVTALLVYNNAKSQLQNLKLITNDNQ